MHVGQFGADYVQRFEQRDVGLHGPEMEHKVLGMRFNPQIQFIQNHYLSAQPLNIVDKVGSMYSCTSSGSAN